LYPIGSWTRLGDQVNIASMELAEAQITEAPAHALGDLSRAIPNEDGNIDPFGLYPDLSRMHKAGTLDDLMAHHVATQQALPPGINLLRRTVKIIAPALLALCLLGLWLALQ
jgi:hypothetical protein